MVGSTFQVPAIPLVAPPSGEAAPVAPALGSTALEGDPASVVAVAAATGGVEPSDTGAGPAGRKNRYHRPAAPATTTTSATIASSGPRREGLDSGLVIADSSGAPTGDGRGGGCWQCGDRCSCNVHSMRAC